MKILVLILFITGVITAAEAADEKIIAIVSSADRITQIHVTNLLLSHDIESDMEGSIVYGVSVPASKAAEAFKLLRLDASKRGYYVGYGSNNVEKAVTLKPVLSRLVVSSALSKTEFASDTAPGRFLRSKEIAELTAKYPYIVSLAVHEHQYLATPNTLAVGYDVQIELRKSLQEHDDGYGGSYQVYDEGRGIGCLGSRRWRVGDK